MIEDNYRPSGPNKVAFKEVNLQKKYMFHHRLQQIHLLMSDGG
jgi:hypothetical protein